MKKQRFKGMGIALDQGHLLNQKVTNQQRELQVKQVATIEDMQMKSEGSRVIFKSLLSLKYPAKVIVPSAITRAIVPASVDSSPPLQVPRESRDDMTRERSAKLIPGPMIEES